MTREKDLLRDQVSIIQTICIIGSFGTEVGFWDQLGFVENVNLHEIVVRCRVDGLEVVNYVLLQGSISLELVFVLSGHGREKIEHVLFGQNCVVCPTGWNPPLIWILLRMVLSGKEWIVFGLQGRHEFSSVWTCASRHEIPEVVEWD